MLDAVADMRAAHQKLLAHGLDRLTHPELLTLLSELETLTRQLPTIGHQVLARLDRDATPKDLGAKSLREVLTTRLRISGSDATRRLAEARDLGARVTLCGEPQDPLLAHTAAAQAQGRISGEHVAVIREHLRHLPGWVDVATREQFEADLVFLATGFAPEQVRSGARHLLARIDQDGAPPHDAERARRRYLQIGEQQSDGMSMVRGRIDPELRAVLEPLLAKLAAPGMGNPADPQPRTSGTPTQEQIDADDRSHGQRVHDALLATGRIALMSRQLGQLNGLPVTVIVSTTLQDLESAAGVARTGGGSSLPMRDLIRMSAHAHHYLAVYDDHTHQPLYLGRSKRLASPAQRILLAHRDGGCTKPGCPATVYQSQVHHLNGWAAAHGQTNIDELTLACGGDNRLAEDGWTVHIRNGITEWTPPPTLDVGQPRINYHHHPQRLPTHHDHDVGDPPDATT